MKLYAVFSRGARGNCLIRLTQYPPLTLWFPVKITEILRHTLIPFTAHSLGNSALQYKVVFIIVT